MHKFVTQPWNAKRASRSTAKIRPINPRERLATMARCDWIMKSGRIGASLGGVAGLLFGIYGMATSHVLTWTEMSDAIESVVVVLLSAVMIGSLGVAVGWVCVLIFGTIAIPFCPCTGKR